MEWSCTACNFSNNGERATCEMCESNAMNYEQPGRPTECSRTTWAPNYGLSRAWQEATHSNLQEAARSRARSNDITAVDALLQQRGCNVNAFSAKESNGVVHKGWTALHYAASYAANVYERGERAQMEQEPHTLMPHIPSHIPEADTICAMQVHTYETWEEDNTQLHDTQYMEEGKDTMHLADEVVGRKRLFSTSFQYGELAQDGALIAVYIDQPPYKK